VHYWHASSASGKNDVLQLLTLNQNWHIICQLAVGKQLMQYAGGLPSTKD